MKWLKDYKGIHETHLMISRSNNMLCIIGSPNFHHHMGGTKEQFESLQSLESFILFSNSSELDCFIGQKKLLLNFYIAYCFFYSETREGTNEKLVKSMALICRTMTTREKN